MRVLLTAVGTRGDVQPVVSLAAELRRRGHDVRLCVRGDRGQPGLRSVDSEHAGRGIGLRKKEVVEADGTVSPEGNIEGAMRRDMFPEACS